MAKGRSLQDFVNDLKRKLDASPRDKTSMGDEVFRKKLGYQKLTQNRCRTIHDALQSNGIILVGLNVDAEGKWNWPEQGRLVFELMEEPANRGTSNNGTSADSLSSDRWESEKRLNKHVSIVKVQSGDHPKRLFDHQKDAVRKFELIFSSERPYAGLIVIPTGGGKTRTAVDTLLRYHVSNGGKVLWVAHRTELLNQALAAFRNSAFSQLMGDRKELRCHLISGSHDQAVKLSPQDDIVIASVQSIRQDSTGGENLEKNWLSHHKNVVLVIDEAHHAPARTYRGLIDTFRKHANPFRMIGLTATPFRTAEREQGHIKKLFPDDITYKTDLRTLINRGILAEPFFRSPETGVSLRNELTEESLRKLELRNFDWSTLDEQSAKSIGENQVRNRAIVDHYLANQQEYGQTIVFALNVPNALALEALFKKKGVMAAFVVGQLLDKGGTRNVSSKEREKAIRGFKDGTIQVLINVNILTEGVDLPATQTVFLARPTTSRTLMMQMIGRGLRGKKAGGTDKSYLVSFLDKQDLGNQIAWVNPEQLFIEENFDFSHEQPDRQKRLLRLISIDMYQQFALMVDELANNDELAKLDFLDRIPLGLYSFSLLPREADKVERQAEVLVYSSHQQAYKEFLAELPTLLQAEIATQSPESDWLEDQLVQELASIAEKQFFIGVDPIPGYRKEDLCDFIQYYYMYELIPDFITFDQREEVDVDKVAKEICDLDLGPQARADYENKLWNKGNALWQAFFGYNNEKAFRAEVSAAINRRVSPDLFSRDNTEPTLSHPSEPLERFTLPELRETHPEIYRKLRDKIFKRYQDGQGFYVCPRSKYRSKNRFDFEIDHIKPFSSGGLTELDNLQLLRRRENRKKGAGS